MPEPGSALRYDDRAMSAQRTFSARLLALAVAAVLLLSPASALAQGKGDTDGDGLWDRFEERWGVTDPRKRDTDRDGHQTRSNNLHVAMT